MKKRTSGALLILLVMVSLFVVFPMYASAAYSGTCGESLNWTLDDAGTLTISGSGRMEGYTASSPAPWNNYLTSIKKVVINDGPLTIGSRAFINCTKLTRVELGNTMQIINKDAFNNCVSLSAITVGVSNTYFSAVDGVLFNKYKTVLRIFPPAKSGNYIVPDSVNEIDQDAFYGCTKLTSVTIPDSVTKIGGSAFFDCQSLRSVNIPYGIKTIDSYTFYQCYALSAIEIPDSVTTIAASAFRKCTKLTAVSIPDSVTYIGKEAFRDCTGIKYLKLSSNLTTAINSAFRNCSGVEALVIPKSLTVLENTVFGLFNSLKYVVIPNTVTSIGASAFRDCYNLTDVYYCGTEAEWNAISIDSENSSHLLGATRHYIKDAGYCGDLLMWKLDENGVLTVSGKGDMDNYTTTAPAPWKGYSELITKVIIEDEVTTIGNNAFSGFTKISELSISDNVKTIGSNSFANCESLSSVDISANVRTINTYAFSDCDSLTQINVDENNTVYSSTDGVLLNKAETMLICYPAGKIGEYTIPDSVTTVYASAFCGAKLLSGVIIGENVTNLQASAFRFCSALETVELPDSITIINNYTFYGCTSLKSITIPTSVTTIEKSAFRDCASLETVYYSGKQSQWDNINIDGSYNSSLTSANIICTIKDGECGNNLTYLLGPDGVLIISGSGEMTNYTSAADVPWRSYADDIVKVVIEDGVTKIGNNAFSKCVNIAEVSIGNTVRVIGINAFLECESLVSVDISSIVQTIGTYAFSDCDSLTKINVDESNATYSSVDGVLFNKDETMLICYPAGKSGEYTIPDSVETVYANAFCGAKHLSGITIGENVTNLQSSAFRFCSALETVELPESISTINSYTFYGCTSLKSITIPTSVVSVGGSAFLDCDSFTDIYYLGFEEEWADVSVTEKNNEQFLNATVHYQIDYTCGENLVWELNESTLVITGSGAMSDFTLDKKAPWYAKRDIINDVVFPQGLTHIGNYAFYDCNALTEVLLPSNDITFGENIFPDNAENLKLVAYYETEAADYCMENPYDYAILCIVNYMNESELISSEEIIMGEEITLPENSSTKEGYDFVGWDVLGEKFNSFDTITVNSNINVTTVWEMQTFTVMYDSQTETYIEPQIKTYWEVLVLSDVIPEKDGAVFMGWSTVENSNIVEYLPGHEFRLNENTVLYAVWDETIYTVTYVMIDAENSIEPQTSLLGKTIQISDELPRRSGYTFLGWATQEGATEPEMFPGERLVIKKNITLYPVWISGIIFGDVDNNGVVEMNDLIMMLKRINNHDIELSQDNMAAMDVFNDTYFNIKDVLKMSQYLSDWSNVVLGE